MASWAEKDNFLEGIQVGDLIGGKIPELGALTIEMGKILHLHFGWRWWSLEAILFTTLCVEAMGNNLCYATSDRYFRHPHLELTADFACRTFLVAIRVWALQHPRSSGTFVTRLEKALLFAHKAKGTQAVLAECDFPNAEFIETSVQGAGSAPCLGECGAVVSDIQFLTYSFADKTGCADKTLVSLRIASPSSATGGGANKYRAP